MSTYGKSSPGAERSAIRPRNWTRRVSAAAYWSRKASYFRNACATGARPILRSTNSCSWAPSLPHSAAQRFCIAASSRFNVANSVLVSPRWPDEEERIPFFKAKSAHVSSPSPAAQIPSQQNPARSRDRVFSWLWLRSGSPSRALPPPEPNHRAPSIPCSIVTNGLLSRSLRVTL